MLERYYPTEEQLFELYRFLTLLKNDKLYWFGIKMDGDTIVIKTEPPKGEIENRIFYICSDGRLDENEFEY